MKSSTIKVRFQPGGRTVNAEPGISLIEAAARAGLIVNTPCGGAATCGKCRVRFLENAPAPTESDARRLGVGEIAEGWRLGCQAHITAEASVEIPSASLLGGYHKIQSESHTTNNRDVGTDIHKICLEMPQPSLEDDAPDLMRLENALKKALPSFGDEAVLHAPPAVLQALAGALREARFSGTATLRGHSLIAFEKGDTTDDAYGLAFDLGTTTLVGALVHLGSGEERGVASAVNPQTAYGDDVLSRIGYAARDTDALAEIRQCLLEQLRAMTQTLCGSAGVSADNVYAAVFAGNTTMQHLLAGLNPASLGMVPFTPTFGRSITFPAKALNLGIHDEAEACLFPVIGGFVGGDTVSGMLATDLCYLEGPILMLDIGTNGEIVLVHDGKVRAASTAAGPAFEGARISCGMRATEGAIEKVLITDDLELGVIGDCPPRGLCGSGLIDLCGQLLKSGALAPNGRLQVGEDLKPGTPDALRRRLRPAPDGQPECVIYEGEGRVITLTQQDVRELQLGAGAIRAGINILLKQAGLVPNDLRQVLIAGGFGSFIRRDNAQRIGLIPHEVPHEKIRFVGNVSFSGAKWAVSSKTAWQEADRVARLAQHVELSLDPDFALEFAMAMQFPEV